MTTDLPAGLGAGTGRERVVLLIAGGFAGLEGFDLASYGVTIPSLLQSHLAPTKQSIGHVGSLLAVGMLVGAGLCALLIRRFGSRRLLFVGAGCSHWACLPARSSARSTSSRSPGPPSEWGSGSCCRL